MDALLRAQLATTPAIAVLSAPTDDPSGWMRAGRALQALLLAAETEGLAVAFVNQPLEVASYRGAFAERFGHPPRRPDLVLRIGRRPARAAARVYSLRRPTLR